MYQIAQKKAFYRTLCEEDRNLAKTMFKKSEQYEVELGVDLADFTAYQFAQFLKDTGVKFTTQRAWYNMLLRYVKWAIENNKTNQVALFCPVAKYKQTQKHNTFVADNMVSGPVHLQQILDKVYVPVVENDCNKNTVATIRRAMIWLMFSGIGINDTNSITADNVDFEKRRIILNGEEYHIYEEAMPALRVACNATQLLAFYGNDMYRVNQRSTMSKSIIRYSSNIAETRMANGTWSLIIDEFSASGVSSIPATNLIASGVFYRLYERETAGIPEKDLWEDFSIYKALIGQSPDIKRRVRDLRIWYESWKNRYKRI